MKIKSYIYPLLLALVTMTSCLSSNDSDTGSDYCYISNVTLGTLKRTVHTTGKSGQDSTYTVTLAGTNFPMAIDLKNRTIENQDSLPYGTRVDALLMTITYTGVIAYKQEGDAEWSAYSSTDSINCSKPLDIVVFSTNGLGEVHYTLKLNVHQQDGSKFSWKQQADCADLTQLKQHKMVCMNDKLTMMGRDANGNVLCATRTTEDGSTWNVSAVSGIDNADISTLLVFGGNTLLMSTTEGGIISSTDGTNWTAAADAVASQKLVGASNDYLYAIAGDTLLSSNDKGATWNEEKLDSDGSMLPNAQISMNVCQQENGYTRLVMVGNNASFTDQNVAVWSKAWKGQITESNAEWMFYNHANDNKKLISQLTPLFIFPYDDGLIAFGGASNDGKQEAMSNILYSPDFGVSWSDAEYELPEELSDCKEAISAAMDKDNYIWIVAGKQTWRGRLNRMGFKVK